MLFASFWLVVALALATASEAEPVQVAFTGTITDVTDPGGMLPPGIVVGTPFSGTYTFDSAAPPPFVQEGSAVFPIDPSSSVSIDIAGNPFTTTPSGVTIQDNVFLPALGQNVDAWFTRVSGCGGCIEPLVSFRDTTLTRISDPSSYFVNSSLTGWTSSVSGMGLIDSGGLPLARGTFNTVQLVSAPAVPSLSLDGGGGLLLLVLGVLGLRALRMRTA
jgi:hypothetical protein